MVYCVVSFDGLFFYFLFLFILLLSLFYFVLGGFGG